MSRRFFITLEVEDMKEFEQLEAFVRDVLNRPEGLQDSTPPASRTTEGAKFYCSNPSCGKEISEKVKEYSEKQFRVALCWECQEPLKAKEKQP